MPYISQPDRVRFDPVIDGLDYTKVTVGDLNYVFSRMLDRTLQAQGLNYTNANALVGMVECCKLEFYRRVLGPYEDKKIEANGDVYHARA